MEGVNLAELVERLGSPEDAARKMAVFRLQSDIGDPSFADVFIQEGGLPKLRWLVMNATHNTLSYSLASFSKLLEVDKGWECVDKELIEKVVELVVTHPLVNILRGAMSILVAIVSRPHNIRSAQAGNFGFRALKPAIGVYPQFLEMLVSRLSSADYGLCANSLQLINSLMRDAITNDSEQEWPKFIKRLQDLGVIKNVYVLMQSSAIQDLAQPLLEFQNLTKVLLRKWKEIAIDLEKPEHRRALKGIHLASNPERPPEKATTGGDDVKRSRRHNPEKWRRLGFETESPAWEFEDVGFLGMMDLTDFVRKQEDGFQKLLLEQASAPASQRCPIARASLAVTLVLYDHFEVASSAADTTYIALDTRSDIDKLFRPLLLQWSRLHTASLQAFFRLWKATGAEMEDFSKIDDLVRILVEQVVGNASRTRDIAEVEEELHIFEYQRLRQLQMELLELGYEETWGHHLRQVKDELHHEAFLFVKEQRIRCLLKGAWFGASVAANHNAVTNGTDHSKIKAGPTSWRYVKLSHNRRYLHWQEYDQKGDSDIRLESLTEKIDLSTVTSVVSNVSTALPASTSASRPGTSSSSSKDSTNKAPSAPPLPDTKIIIHGTSADKATETPLLALHPSTPSLASEWLDGLLMLLSQAPITAETTKLADFIGQYGLKIRLLNVRFDDANWGIGGPGTKDGPEIPSREGLDEDYYYDVFGGA